METGESFAECAVHGVMLGVDGMGVLLRGASGSGKSSLALELLDRGHCLVSDDAPLLRIDRHRRLLARASELLHGYLQVGGLGVIDVGKLFGPTAIAGEQPLDLVIQLSASAPAPSKLEPDSQRCRLLGVELPAFRLVAAAGLNRALWAECAVRQLRLRQCGYHAERTLTERQTAASAGSSPCA